MLTPLDAAAPTSSEVDGEGAPPALDATLIADLPKGTFGPHIGQGRGGTSLAIWAADGADRRRRWYSCALDARGAPRGVPRALGDAPPRLSLATVAPTREGFLVLATHATDAGTRLTAMPLGPLGEPGRTPPLVIAQSRSDIVWIDVLAAGESSVAVWATLGAHAADIHVAALAALQERRSEPLPVMARARAWQAVEYRDGIAVVAVTEGTKDFDHALRVGFFGPDGRRLGQTDVVKGRPLEAEVDAAPSGDNLVLAWTELEGLEPRVMLAALGPDTRVAATPRPLGTRFGPERLIELLPSAEPRAPAFVVWEVVGQAPRGERLLQVGRVSPRAELDRSRAELRMSGGPERPEVAAKGEGLAAVVRASPCRASASRCAPARAVPTYVELDAALEPIASEPIRLAEARGRSVELAWGLTCSAESCAVLGALSGTPVPVYGVALEARRDQRWVSVASVPVVEATWPRALDMHALLETEPLADLEAVSVGRTRLVASVTQFDESTPYVRRKTPAPDGRLTPLRALLSVQPLGANGAATGAPSVVSYRARSPGGIALVPAGNDGALLVWSALDHQRPELFATLLNRQGEARAQRMFTQGAGNVTSLTAAASARSFDVAWIAERQGSARLVTTRLDSKLGSIGAEQVLSSAAATPEELSLSGHDDGAWLAWLEREEGRQLLRVTRLDPSGGTRLADDLLLERGEGVALSSPVIARHAGGALLGWIERPPPGGSAAPEPWLVELDGAARPRAQPRALRGAHHAAAMRLLCGQAGCFGAVDQRLPGGAVVQGFLWEALDARALVRRTAMGSDPTGLALTASDMFYTDRAPGRSSLVRRAAVEWAPSR